VPALLTCAVSVAACATEPGNWVHQRTPCKATIEELLRIRHPVDDLAPGKDSCPQPVSVFFPRQCSPSEASQATAVSSREHHCSLPTYGSEQRLGAHAYHIQQDWRARRGLCTRASRSWQTTRCVRPAPSAYATGVPSFSTCLNAKRLVFPEPSGYRESPAAAATTTTSDQAQTVVGKSRRQGTPTFVSNATNSLQQTYTVLLGCLLGMVHHQALRAFSVDSSFFYHGNPGFNTPISPVSLDSL